MAVLGHHRPVYLYAADALGHLQVVCALRPQCIILMNFQHGGILL